MEIAHLCWPCLRLKSTGNDLYSMIIFEQGKIPFILAGEKGVAIAEMWNEEDPTCVDR